MGILRREKRKPLPLAVADWDMQTGENLSLILNKNTGTAYPVIQLKPGGLIYVPQPETFDIANAFVTNMMDSMMHCKGVEDKQIIQKGVVNELEASMQNNNDKDFNGSAPAGSMPNILTKILMGLSLQAQ